MYILTEVDHGDYHPSFNALIFFFFNDTATTEIYTLSLHDALPICTRDMRFKAPVISGVEGTRGEWMRSEEHTSELQSLAYLVCRLLLEKKKKYIASRG